MLNNLASLSAENLQNRVDISVFFESNVTQEQLESIKIEFEQYPEVASARVITADEALERFRLRHEDDPLVQATLNELSENPLQSSLVLTAHELDQYPVLYQQLQRSRFEPLINVINYEDNRGLIETLDRVTSGIRTFGIVLTAVFGFVAVLVMFNTLRLTIFSRREEIEIMRLVGASQAYIQGPFIIEGVVYGIVATVIASAIFYPALSSLAPAIERFFGIDFSAGQSLQYQFLIIALYMLLVGVLLGVVSSIIATRKYLKE
jgi:cell division transport system permease protein